MPIRVAVIGAGPIGALVAREVVARRALSLVGVVDVDPKKIGERVEGVVVQRELPKDAEVAVLATTSSLQRLTPSLLELIGRGVPVVSTCEELAWPWTQRALAQAIDDAAVAKGVAVLGTGVNPGFLMDALPLFLTAPCRSVTRLRIERIQDAATRRRPFQDKVGVGMEPSDVEPRLKARTTGHVGLEESAAMLATRLGLAVDGFREESAVVIADEDVTRAGRTVKKGQVKGVEQRGTSTAGGAVVLELFFRATFGEAEPRDHIVIEGEPRVDVTIAGGLPGDVATAAIVANAIPALKHARPGLRTMAEFPLVHFVG